MGLESAREHLKKWGKDRDIQILEVAAATVATAATALGVAEAQIAKTISLKQPDKGALLIVVGGCHKIDNKKFKAHFGFKARMLGFEEVEPLLGHPVGGVCPFGVKPGIPVYLDVSLQDCVPVYPACGNAKAVIELSIAEMEQMSTYVQWVDVATL
ncbi:YbaK/EbsC family protein [Flavobacterium sp. JP2137]|uniref:YbaK/EbsC family protein n=1 Tax=Flavobacterium sp. JP2137 TaxID=3414510 RepID=UPI003D2FA5E7